MGTQQVVGKFKGEAIWAASSVAICRPTMLRRVQDGNWLELAILELGKISFHEQISQSTSVVNLSLGYVSDMPSAHPKNSLL